MLRGSPLLLVLVPALVAQTYVVDALNRPGANFTSIAAAVAAVPDGAVLLVRASGYASFTVAGKGVAILCETNTSILGPVTISGTSSSQHVTLSQFLWPVSTVTTGNVLLTVQNCAGPVLVQGISQPTYIGTPRATGILVVNSAQVMLRDSSILCTASFTDSVVAVESCRIEGEFATIVNSMPVSARDAVTLTRGSLQVGGSTALRGGDGIFGSMLFAVNAAGIRMTDADLRVLDGSVTAGQLGGSSSAIVASGTNSRVRVSTRAVLVASPIPVGYPLVTGVTAVVAPLPGLRCSGGPLGTSLTATADSEAGDLVVLLLGFRGAPTLVPGIADAFWIDPQACFFHTIGTQGIGTPVVGSLAVPNLPYVLGTTIQWQAVAFGPVTGLQASNPSAGLVR